MELKNEEKSRGDDEGVWSCLPNWDRLMVSRQQCLLTEDFQCLSIDNLISLGNLGWYR